MAVFPGPEYAILHVVGQANEHDPVDIVGNELALRRLRDAIDAALQQRGVSIEMEEPIWVSDGEGYRLVVRCQPDLAEDRMPNPYIGHWYTGLDRKEVLNEA
jgi:hypothetical protein